MLRYRGEPVIDRRLIGNVYSKATDSVWIKAVDLCLHLPGFPFLAAQEQYFTSLAGQPFHDGPANAAISPAYQCGLS